jgi:GTP-binding protein
MHGASSRCNIKRIEAHFVLSAASPSQFPGTGVPEIAMVGRSNVGKSSLINALVKQKMARTSAAAGKTRLVNYYLIEPETHRQKPLYLVDLPGYGYARGGAESVEAFGQLTREYFDPTSQPGRQIGGVLHLIDARHPTLRQDFLAHEWLVRRGVPVTIVATKMDKLNRSEQRQTLKILEKHGAVVVPSSVPDGTGQAEIWKIIHQWAATL